MMIVRVDPGSGGPGPGGGGQPRRPIVEKRQIRVSKYLAKFLRHSPGELGLTLRPVVGVPLDALLTAGGKPGFPISYDELVDCVEANDKRRFSFDETGDLIR